MYTDLGWAPSVISTVTGSEGVVGSRHSQGASVPRGARAVVDFDTRNRGLKDHTPNHDATLVHSYRLCAGIFIMAFPLALYPSIVLKTRSYELTDPVLRKNRRVSGSTRSAAPGSPALKQPNLKSPRLGTRPGGGVTLNWFRDRGHTRFHPGGAPGAFLPPEFPAWWRPRNTP